MTNDQAVDELIDILESLRVQADELDAAAVEYIDIGLYTIGGRFEQIGNAIDTEITKLDNYAVKLV